MHPFRGPEGIEPILEVEAGLYDGAEALRLPHDLRGLIAVERTDFPKTWACEGLSAPPLHAGAGNRIGQMTQGGTALNCECLLTMRGIYNKG